MLFRSKKAKKSTPAESLEAFRRGLNDLVDAAERNRVGLGEFATVLSQTSETLKYRIVVGSASSFHTSTRIEHIGR